MSAKWRRSRKNLERFNVLRAFGKRSNKKTPRKFQLRNSESKKQLYHSKYHVRKFSPEKLQAPAPLIDTVERDGEVAVIAELVGFSQEDLKIDIRGQKLILSAQASSRKYRKSLNLPGRVIPSTICTSYKNGVLEIRVKKAAEEKSVDKVAG